MEENKITDNPKSTRKYFLLGMLVSGIILSVLFVGNIIHKNNLEKKQRILQEAEERNRASIVADSLKKVNAQKAIYYNMIQFIKERDSVRKTLRYRIGDVVYLKPDSVMCVVADITSDSTMSDYSYLLISNNKNIEPGIIIRNDKLIY